MKLLHFVFCLVIINSISAQQNESKAPKLKLSEIGAFRGIGLVNFENYNPAIQNPFVQSDLKFPAEDYDYFDDINFLHQRFIGVQAGFWIHNKSKNKYSDRVKLQFGLNLVQSSDGLTSFNQSRTRVDTVFVEQYNQFFSVDSFYNESFTYDYRFNQIRLETSLQFYTSPVNQLQFYTGIGVGLAFSNKRSLSYQVNERIVNLYRSLTVDSLIFSEQLPGANNTRSGDVNLSNQFSAYVFVPLGFQIRLGVGDSFLSRLSVFGELRPLLFAETARNEKSRFHLSSSFMLGIRFKP